MEAYGSNYALVPRLYPAVGYESGCKVGKKTKLLRQMNLQLGFGFRA